jgi:hypothetical protein
MVLQVLREYQLYAKLIKCSFYQRKIHYLGHIILEEGIPMYPKNIEEIEGWPTPRNFIEVISFMGLADYYRIFVEGFSRIVHPITSFPRKGVRFDLTSKCEESFQHLKKILKSAPFEDC